MADNLPNIVEKIRHILRKHKQLSPDETSIVLAWLERLLRKPDSDEQKSNLLKYARYLNYQLKEKNLGYPFDRIPPRGDLAPLSQVINEQLSIVNEIIGGEVFSEPLEHKSKDGERHAACDWDPNKWMTDTTDEPCKQQSSCSDILREASKPNVKLHEFLINIQPYTDDKGELIRQIAVNELKAFRELVYRIFTDRLRQVDKILSSRQCLLKQNYRNMEQQVLNRAKIAQDHLKQLLPGFNYNEYAENENYIRDILLEIEDNQKNICDSEKIDPETTMREKQFKLKFLRDEVKHGEEKNEELMEEYNNLMMKLNEVIKEQQEKVAQSLKRNKDLKGKLAGLKITEDENQVILNKLNMERTDPTSKPY